MLRREFEEKEKEKKRKESVLALFKDQEERESLGFTDKVLRYMRKEIIKYRCELTIEEGKLIKEEDYVAVDDTWLDLYLMMFHKFRNDFTDARLA
jgi:hypothetical protein